MFEKLPDLIDPVHCAEHNMRFQARVNQSAMKRLLDQVRQPNGEVEVDIVFSRHPQLKTPQFELSVKTDLVLECQRTLEAFVYPVDRQTQGVYVSVMSMAEDLDEDIEVYEMPEGKVSLLELVEDEVLLAIPMVPRQEGEMLSWQDEAFEEVELSPADDNPFAKLQDLKK